MTFIIDNNGQVQEVSFSSGGEPWYENDRSNLICDEEGLKNKYGIEHYYEGALFMAED